MEEGGVEEIEGEGVGVGGAVDRLTTVILDWDTVVDDEGTREIGLEGERTDSVLQEMTIIHFHSNRAGYQTTTYRRTRGLRSPIGNGNA